MAIHAKCGGRCAYCGCRMEFPGMQCDHLDSLHNHGEDGIGNLLPSCRDCNHFKGACSLEGFRKRLKSFLKKEPQTPFQSRIMEKYHGWNGVFFFEELDNHDNL